MADTSLDWKREPFLSYKLQKPSYVKYMIWCNWNQFHGFGRQKRPHGFWTILKKTDHFEIYKVIRLWSVQKMMSSFQFVIYSNVCSCQLLELSGWPWKSSWCALEQLQAKKFIDLQCNGMCTLSIMQWECVLDVSWVVKFPTAGFKISSNSLQTKTERKILFFW